MTQKNLSPSPTYNYFEFTSSPGPKISIWDALGQKILNFWKLESHRCSNFVSVTRGKHEVNYSFHECKIFESLTFTFFLFFGEPNEPFHLRSFTSKPYCEFKKTKNLQPLFVKIHTMHLTYDRNLLISQKRRKFRHKNCEKNYSLTNDAKFERRGPSCG